MDLDSVALKKNSEERQELTPRMNKRLGVKLDSPIECFTAHRLREGAACLPLKYK